MRKLGASGLAILLSVGFASALGNAEWKEHISKEGRFKIKFPGEPTKQKQEGQSAAGPLTMHIFGVERNAGKEAFMLMYNDYPEAAVQGKNTADLLKACRDGVLKSSEGKVSKEKSIKVSGHTGLEFHFAGTVGGMEAECSWRIILVNNRLYQLAVLRGGQAPAPEDVRQFFDSFALVN